MVASAAGFSPEVLDAFQERSDELQRAREARRSATPLSPEAADAFERAARETATRPPRAHTPLSDEAKESFDQASEESTIQPLLPSGGSLYRAWTLRLDLDPETVLASSNGSPFVNVQEFNRRVRATHGDDLYDARYKALQQIIRTRLTAHLAREAGYERHRQVEYRLAQAIAAADRNLNIDPDRYEVSDAQALDYYRKHTEEFRQPDRGSRALLAVRGSEHSASELLSRVRAEPASKTFWSSPNPVPGSHLPQALQDALFHLAPGDLTDVVTTPTGYYVAQLVERNSFDHFLVNLVTGRSAVHAQEMVQQMRAGRSFASLMNPKQTKPVPATDLPASVQGQVRDMELGQVSEPIDTPLGVMLVKLQQRWSEAAIDRATVVRVESVRHGNQILPRLRSGQEIDGIAQRSATEDDLPAKLHDVARTLKEGEYSAPIETDFGIFLVRVDKREREQYRPFASAKEDVKRRLRAAKIPDADKLAYYDAHREQYRKTQPDYIVDIVVSGGEEGGQALLEALEGIADEAERRAAFDDALQRRGFERVSTVLLPEACQLVATQLSTGEVSKIVTTELGHFVLRLREIRDPAYVAFEDVEVHIGTLLADRERAALRDLAILAERNKEIDIETAEERALAQVYLQEYMMNLNTVSDQDAEKWWQQDKAAFFEAFGANVDEIPADVADAELVSRKIKKMNLLGKRLEQQVQDRYVADRIVIFEHLLTW